MKKACRIFLTITFWLAVVVAVVSFVSGLLGLIYSQAFIDWLVAASKTTPETIEEIKVVAQIGTYILFISLLVASLAMIGPLVLCPITKRKLETANSRDEMIVLGILNIFFGSTIAAIMIFIMDDSHYRNIKSFY